MHLDDITPLVLTFDEELNIGRCLDGLRWATRVIVLDSGSTDGTERLVRSVANADWHMHAFVGHAAQWNLGLDMVATEWALAIDADYILDEQFRQELATLRTDPSIDAYNATFRYVVFGRPLRGSLYPPRAMLFRARRCRYRQDGHTQLLEVSTPTGSLLSAVDHDDRKPLSRWIQSQQRYALLEADKLLSTPPSEMRIQDRIRLTVIPAAPLALAYSLFAKGTLFDGWRGWYYAIQRAIAEAILSLYLIQRRSERATEDIP